jgi:hypothetical protein
MKTSSRVTVPAHRLGQRLADHLLGTALAVHLRRVDHAVADLQRETHRGDFARSLAGRLAHAPGAQAEGRCGTAIGEADMLHGRGL